MNEKMNEVVPSNDAISRKEAIKKFTYNYKGKRIPEYDCENWPVQIDIKTVKEVLRDLPPVTPQSNDILDKIKAEIIELRSKQNVGVLECLNIIDKYRTGINNKQLKDMYHE